MTSTAERDGRTASADRITASERASAGGRFGVRVRRPGAETGAGLLAAVLAMASYCLGTGLLNIYPFGSRGRAINDLGNQFVPFHAHLWDLMHGTGTAAGSGDLFFNWNSGFGVPFLADFFTYLVNPFSWLTYFFARSSVDLPVFLTTLFSIGLAAWLMTAFLRRLHPGSPWLRGLLGAGYGVCAWALNDASADPMWLWGLISIPMLGIVLDWALRGPLRPGRWVGGSLLVALAWFGNFYTAAMASLCAVLVLLVRLWLAEGPETADLRGKARVLLRAASMVVTGLVLTLPVLTVSMNASKDAHPAMLQTFKLLNPLDFAAQLFPGARVGFSVPYVAMGMLGLLLVLTFPFQRAVRGRERALWLGLVVVVALSFLWEPTVLLWQGFTLPNGSPYREAFVLSALGTMVAWLALARRPRPGELLGGAGLTLLLVLISLSRPGSEKYSWLAAGLFGALTLASLLALHFAYRKDRGRGRNLALRAVGGVLAALVLGCSTLSVYGLNSLRNQLSYFAPHETMDATSRAAHSALLATDTWPNGRTDSGPHQFADNDPLLVGGQGGAYYSSYVPSVTARTLMDLGMGWYMAGRHLLSPRDPGSQAIFGVTHSLVSSGPHNGFVQTANGPGAPLVTVHQGNPKAKLPPNDPFALQNLLLGGQVWSTPQPQRSAGGTHLAVSCPTGTQLWLNAPWTSGTVTASNGASAALTGTRGKSTANPLRPLGTAPAGGTVGLTFGSGKNLAGLPAHPVGCLSTSALTAAVQKLRSTGATHISAGGHSVSATLPAHSTGTAVIATTAVPGWSCAVDGRSARPAKSFHGLLAVPLGSGASSVSCSYTPPGLHPGLAGTGAALAALILVPVAARIRRPRSPRLSTSER